MNYQVIAIDNDSKFEFSQLCYSEQEAKRLARQLSKNHSDIRIDEVWESLDEMYETIEAKKFFLIRNYEEVVFKEVCKEVKKHDYIGLNAVADLFNKDDGELWDLIKTKTKLTRALPFGLSSLNRYEQAQYWWDWVEPNSEGLYFAEQEQVLFYWEN